MAEIVNLRMARKQKARAERERAAASNRALHGLSKAECEKQRIESDRTARGIEGHRRVGPADGDGKGS